MGDFNYKDKSAPKLTDDFKKKFIVNIKGKDAIKVDGLIALAHEKGIKSMTTSIIQYPSQENKWTCIAQTIVVGYDWDPIEDKLTTVEYQDFADSTEANCTAMTKASYIRMASTRSVGRTLRKYTNIDMVSSDEIGDSFDNHEPGIDQSSLEMVKLLLHQKGLNQAAFGKIMFDAFNHTSYMGLTQSDGIKLVNILKALPAPQPVPAQQTAPVPQPEQTSTPN